MTNQLLHMSKRDIDRYTIIQQYIKKEISRIHAAKLLDLTPRHITRLKYAVLATGAKALVHRQRGQPSHHRLSDKEHSKIARLLHDKYPDFGPTFAAEKLKEIHQIEHDPKTIRSIQIAEGLWKSRPTSKDDTEYRSWRQRRSAYGELIQFDGSYHPWLEYRGGTAELCLLAAIDDATGKIIHAEFAAHEGVFPVFSFWKAYVEIYGKPRQIYLDRFSTYKMNSQVAQDNPDLKTQFQRAMATLHIEPIFALSPQAKGRVERLFDTLQDRLVKELRLRNIKTIQAANQFLIQEFIPTFNAKFSVPPSSMANLHQILTNRERTVLPSIFSRREERTIQNDFTFSFKTQWYQLTKQQPATICKKDRVIIEEHLDGTLHVRFKGKELNYLQLPERPKKVQTSLFIAQTAAASWKPAPTHPWRQSTHLQVLKVPTPPN